MRDMNDIFEERLQEFQEYDKTDLVKLTVKLEIELFFLKEENLDLLTELFLSDSKLFDNH